MSIEELIRAAAEPTCGKVYPRVYTGGDTEYAVFNYSEYGRAIGEGSPAGIVYSVQLHWFLPRKKNPRAGKNAIRQALTSRGCTWPQIIDAGDSDGQHYVFEFEYAGDA